MSLKDLFELLINADLTKIIEAFGNLIWLWMVIGGPILLIHLLYKGIKAFAKSRKERQRQKALAESREVLAASREKYKNYQ